MDRRTFLNTGIKTTLGAAAFMAANPRSSRAYAANDKIVFAQIGLGGRGKSVGREFARIEGVEMKYCCDVDSERAGGFSDQVEAAQGKVPKALQDFREALDDKDIDAVIVSTPDHWHALAAIWACQAGKDVYVEKPPSHNVWEGRKMVEAARKYDRVVQVGTQNRSAPYVKEAKQYIDEGNIGKLVYVKVFGMEPGGAYREPENSKKPDSVDYDMYLGPAPKRPFNRGHFHSNWHNYWAYSGGDLADDGVHQMDIARWIMGKDYPKFVSGYGSNVGLNDDRDVFDTQSVIYDYGDLMMTWELTQWATYMRKTPTEVRNSDAFPDWSLSATRVEFYGTKGRMVMGRHGGGWQAVDHTGKVVAGQYGRMADPEHRANFAECIRSRKRPNADIEEGHRSAILTHAGNIATRMQGERLEFDSKTERFKDNDAANAFVKRDYRSGYEVPVTV